MAHWLEDRLASSIARHPLVVLGAVAVSIAVALALLVDLGSGRLRLSLDASFERVLPRSGEKWRVYEELRKVFGEDETVVVALHTPAVFTPDVLERVDRITRRLERVPGVFRVRSLTSAREPVADGSGFPVPRSIAGAAPFRAPAVERIRSAILANPLYASSLVSRDERTTAIVVEFLDLSDDEYIARHLSDEITAIAESEADGLAVSIGGTRHMKDAQYRYQVRDLATALPLIALVLGAVLWLMFRRVTYVALALATVAVALLWTLAVVAARGEPLNLVTILVVPILTILGISYSVHVLAEFEHLADRAGTRDRRAIAAEALASVFVPILLTGGTTAIGFIAVLFQDIEAVREFGAIAALGVAFTVLASLALPPAVLALGGAPRRTAMGGQAVCALLGRMGAYAAGFAWDHRRGLLASAGVCFVVAALGASRIDVSADGVEAFPASSRVHRDFVAIRSALGVAGSLHVVLESEPRGFREPETLAALEALQRWLDAQSEITSTVSIVDHLRVCNRGLDGDATIPASASAVGELLFWCGPEMRGFLTNGYDYTRITAHTNVSETHALRSLVDRIHRHAANAKLPFDVTVTGSPVLTTELVARIVRGQLASIGAAFVVIYLLLAALFRSVRLGLLAMIPNVLPIAVYFGALGFSGVPLNLTTSVIAPMILGIAIDDTLHLLTRYLRECERTSSAREAARVALAAVGRPITYTTLALCAGFGVLMFAEMRNQVQLGALGAFTLAFAWWMEFTLTPAVAGFAHRTPSSERLRTRPAPRWAFGRMLRLGRTPRPLAPGA